MSQSNYKINGKLNTALLKELPKGLKLKVYAVRDRRVLGSSAIDEDGSFNIAYKYGAYEVRGKKLAVGPSLVIGPDMPGDAVLKGGFPKVFLKHEAIIEKAGEYVAAVPAATLKELFSKPAIERVLVPWWKQFCHEWRPCVQIISCSRIENGICYGEQPLLNMRVRIYEVGQLLFGHGQVKNLVAEGDTDQWGYFRFQKTICFIPWADPAFFSKGYLVEVGQMIDGAFNLVYADSPSELRDLESDLCEEIYILKTDVIVPTEDEGMLTGNVFRLTRIGNIPVGYINQNVSSPFHGYADSHGATDSATLKVVDSAFYSSIKLFANIGAAAIPNIKYFRIKCIYEQNGTTIESDVQTPFNNLRESTDAEKPIFGPYKTEYLGPIDGVYTYPNPYSLAVNEQWVYKGLIGVINTGALPLSYGKFTFRLVPLKADKTPATVDNTDGLECTILVDNTAPTGSISDIIGPSGIAPACGILRLPLKKTRVACDGNTRNVVEGRITVPFNVSDQHSNLKEIYLSAHFGDVCDAGEKSPVSLVGPGKRPEVNCSPGHSGCNGTAIEYQSYDDVPSGQRPYWYGNQYCSSKFGEWDECAYEFRLTVYKRLTNGEVAYPWWTFPKYITISTP